jgi:hypothetical protein
MYIPLNLARIFYGGFSIKDSDPLILVRADNVIPNNSFEG